MAYITITNEEEVMTLCEGILPSDMESEFFCAHLVERLRWAIEDAHVTSRPVQATACVYGLTGTLINAYAGRTRGWGAPDQARGNSAPSQRRLVDNPRDDGAGA